MAEYEELVERLKAELAEMIERAMTAERICLDTKRELADANEGERKLVGRYNDIVAELAEARAEIERLRPALQKMLALTKGMIAGYISPAALEDAEKSAEQALAAPAREAERPCPVCGGLKGHDWNCSLDQTAQQQAPESEDG